MVFHVAINLNSSPAIIYNTEDGTSIKFEYKRETLKTHDIDLLFQSLASEINGKLGCACVVVAPDDGNNDRRRHLIKSAIDIGFEKVKLIDRTTAFFYFVVSQTYYKPKNGDVILIFTANLWYLWHKENEKATFISSGTKSIIYLKQKNVYPNVVYFCKSVYQNQTFPNTKVLVYDMNSGIFSEYQEGALVKTRIMAKDPDMIEFNANTVLAQPFCITTKNFNDIRWFEACDPERISTKQQRKFEPGEKLPITRSSVIESAEDRNILSILTDAYNIMEVISLPINKKFQLNMSIEKSGIFNINVDIIEKLTHRNSIQKYVVPQNINFHGSHMITAVGIDLGTTRCCAAVNRSNGIETVVLENTGERLLPSYVSFDEEKEKCGNIAISRMRYNSKATIFDAKRIIGKSFEDIIIDSSWEFDVVQDNNFQQYNAENLNQFQLLENNNVLIKMEINNKKALKHPEEISAALLKHIKQNVAEFQGKNLAQVTIAVPSTFSDTQKDSTCAAAIMAGWKIVNFIPEPIAAAFAYLVNLPLVDNSKFLLFDLGGGTLDICIFKCHRSQIEILSQNGDLTLGGRDFDNILIKHFLIF